MLRLCQECNSLCGLRLARNFRQVLPGMCTTHDFENLSFFNIRGKPLWKASLLFYQPPTRKSWLIATNTLGTSKRVSSKGEQGNNTLPYEELSIALYYILPLDIFHETFYFAFVVNTQEQMLFSMYLPTIVMDIVIVKMSWAVSRLSPSRLMIKLVTVRVSRDYRNKQVIHLAIIPGSKLIKIAIQSKATYIITWKKLVNFRGWTPRSISTRRFYT